MKKKINIAITYLTLIILAVFVTCWLNIIPTLWKPEVLDLSLLWGITVRSILTFHVLLIPALLLRKQIARVQKIIWLAALVPFLLWGFKVIFYIDGGSELAKAYPIFGVMLGYTFAMMVVAFILEVMHHTLSWKDMLEDFLFTLALALMFYGIITLLGLEPFEANTLGMAPVLAIVQLWLAKSYHTPQVTSA